MWLCIVHGQIRRDARVSQYACVVPCVDKFGEQRVFRAAQVKMADVAWAEW